MFIARSEYGKHLSDPIKPTGHIKYPPHENVDRASRKLMEPFEIFPLGEIGHYCAQVPYSSDKKDVKQKTGRDKLESASPVRLLIIEPCR